MAPRIIHGHYANGARTPTYRTWDSMVQRCTNFNHKDFDRYGKVGIDPRFLGPGGFLRFVDLVGNRPSKAHTLDRIDPERGYYPENLRWALNDVQQKNKVWPRHYGRTVEDWSRVLGVKPTTIRKRRERGWSDDRLFPVSFRLTGGTDVAA